MSETVMPRAPKCYFPSPMRRERRRTQSLCAGSVLLAFFAGESLLRWAAPFRIEPDGAVLRRQRGSVARMVRRYEIDGVDMWEYRTDRPRPSRLRGDIRVVGIGDSIMEPHWLPWRQGFFDLLLDEMRRSNPRHPADGINLSVGGYNILQDKLMLREQGLARKPTLVLLQMWQDDDTPYRLIDNELYNLPYSLLMQRRRDETNRACRLLQRSYSYTLVQLLLLRGQSSVSPPPISASEQLRDIQGSCRRAGAELLVVLFPVLDRPFAQQSDPRIYREVKGFASLHGIPVVDMRARFQEAGDDPRAIRLDDIHYNPEGHRRIASILSQDIRALFDADGRRRPAARSRHEICAAVARGDEDGCRHLAHYPPGDCLLQVSLKRAARGERDSCLINETPFARSLCEMIASGRTRCGELGSLAAGFDSAKSYFERAETFIKVCALLDAAHIAECREAGRAGVPSKECEIARFFWAYQRRDAGSCAELHDRRSRENCRALLTDDVGVCTQWIDYSRPVDPPWWRKP